MNIVGYICDRCPWAGKEPSYLLYFPEKQDVDVERGVITDFPIHFNDPRCPLCYSRSLTVITGDDIAETQWPNVQTIGD